MRKLTETSPLVSNVDHKLLTEWRKTNSVTASAGNQLKPFRCSGKYNAEIQLTEFKTLLNNGSFILTFKDQVTVEVFAVHGIFDRARKMGYCNHNRYFIICEIQGD